VEEGLVNTTYNREEKKTRWASGVGNARRSSPRGQFDANRFKGKGNEGKMPSWRRNNAQNREQKAAVRTEAKEAQPQGDEAAEESGEKEAKESWTSRLFRQFR